MTESEPRQRWTLGFRPQFLDDMGYWIEQDRTIALRLISLMQAVARDPFTGLGRPERLRHVPGNTWSRRLTQEHRITYLVVENQITFLQARFHY